MFGGAPGGRGARDGDDVDLLVRGHPPGRAGDGPAADGRRPLRPREFGLESALPGQRGEDLLRATAQSLADRFVAAYDQLRTDHHDTLAALAVAGTPLAPELRGPIELALPAGSTPRWPRSGGSTDPGDYQAVRTLARGGPPGGRAAGVAPGRRRCWPGR